MSIVSTQATASHRYYMRKTKAEIRLRIRDMVDMIPSDVIEYASMHDKPDTPALGLWLLKIGIYDALEGWDKHHLATIAMKAHSLLPEEEAS
tara:strand:- start:181 stop:456 length:276 start_codon:yes stop_codon:yes gene_type:complete